MRHVATYVQDCLRDKAVSVSWECQEELFRQEVENADDLRLSQRLFKKCMGDKKRFCSDIKFGVLQHHLCVWSLPCQRDVCMRLQGLCSAPSKYFQKECRD